MLIQYLEFSDLGMSFSALGLLYAIGLSDTPDIPYDEDSSDQEYQQLIGGIGDLDWVIERSVVFQDLIFGKYSPP